MRAKINIFVSYARSNERLANDLILKLEDELQASRRYEYSLWNDSMISVGADWHNEIVAARDICDVGLLLISPAFLTSRYIAENELPFFVGDNHTPSVPVMLQAVDFNLQDTKGLEESQVFRFSGRRFTEPRAYGEIKSPARNDFVHALFQSIEAKLSK
jgi:hypothetical protein